jgi:hypothetical protein
VRRLTRVVMALSAVVLMAQLSWAAEGVRVTAERANLRSKPSTESDVVAKVAKGTILPVLGREGSWVRVSAPGSGATAYISARLCEPATVAAPPPPVATTAPPATSPAPSSGSAFKSSRSASATEPIQFGGQLDFASSSIGFGLGIRASSGIPVLEGLGVLGTFDFYFGAQSIADPAGVEVDATGHSLQFGLYPTYSHEFGDFRVYGGAGLSILGTSYTISVATPDLPNAEMTGSQWDTSLGLVAGVKYKQRFFGEIRNQFGGGSHVTFSAGVVFDSPF